MPGATKVTVEVTFTSATGRKTQRLAGVDVKACAGKTLIVRRAA